MTTPLRVLLVEDEAPARRRLRSLLVAEPGVTVVGEAATPSEARAFLKPDLDPGASPERRPNVLFLDIHLHRESGFDVLEALADGEPPVVVFVTAYDEHAVRAFEVGAVDYLLKPFDDERFARCLERVRRRVDERRGLDAERLAELLRKVAEGTAAQAAAASAATSAAEGGDHSHTRRLAIRGEGRTLYVEVDDLRWAEAADYCVRLHLVDGPRLMRTSLRELEERLDPTRFVRVHRSAIVRVDQVRELRSTFRGDAVAVLDGDVRVPVSRRYRRRLEDRLGAG